MEAEGILMHRFVCVHACSGLLVWAFGLVYCAYIYLGLGGALGM